MSGPVTSVARVEDVQIFLKDPVHDLLFLEFKADASVQGKTEIVLIQIHLVS